MQLVAGPSRLPLQQAFRRVDVRAPSCSIEACRRLHSAGRGIAARRTVRIRRPEPSYRRLNSSISTASPASPLAPHGRSVRRSGGAEAKQGERSEEEQRAYDSLRPIIDALPGPVDWAVAYGSGVRHQANTDPTGVRLLPFPSHVAEFELTDSHHP
jgi:translocator assembly and maintenance protein 41